MGCVLRRGPPTIQAAIAPQPATMERGRNRRGVQPGRIGGLPTSIAPPAMHAAVEPHCAGVIRTHFNRLIGTRLACRPAVIHRFPAPAFHAAVHAQGTGMPEVGRYREERTIGVQEACPTTYIAVAVVSPALDVPVRLESTRHGITRRNRLIRAGRVRHQRTRVPPPAIRATVRLESATHITAHADRHVRPRVCGFRIAG